MLVVSTWRGKFSVLVARGRAQVGVHSAKTDWSRRILDLQYMDYTYDDQAAHIRRCVSRQFGVGVVLWYSAQVVSGVFSDSQCTLRSS